MLDLTRVMAGPVCTRLLAAYGADVLRIDPPGFEEVGALLPEMTAGKRRAFLDLRDSRQTARPSSGSSQERTWWSTAIAPTRSIASGSAPRVAARLNPSLIDVAHDAYGWTGPWAHRRGFDSLVQMSGGIADEGRAVTGADATVPPPRPGARSRLRLPARRGGRAAPSRDCWSIGAPSDVRLSLARTAKLLVDLGDVERERRRRADRCRDRAMQRDGRRPPGGRSAASAVPAGSPTSSRACRSPPGPLGCDAPAWP